MKPYAFSLVGFGLLCSVALLGCEPMGEGAETSPDSSVEESDSGVSGTSGGGQQVELFVQPRDNESSFGTTPIMVGLSASGTSQLEESFDQLSEVVRLMEVDLEQDPAVWRDTETEFEVVKETSPNGFQRSWRLEAQSDQLAKDMVYAVEVVDLPEGVEMNDYHGFVWNKERLSWVSRFIRIPKPVLRGVEICPGASGKIGSQFTAHLSERVSVIPSTAQEFSFFEGTTEFTCEMQTPPNRVSPDGTVRGEFGVEFVCDELLDLDTTYRLTYDGGMTSMATSKSVNIGLLSGATSLRQSFKLSNLLYDGRPCRWLALQ